MVPDPPPPPPNSSFREETTIGYQTRVDSRRKYIKVHINSAAWYLQAKYQPQKLHAVYIDAGILSCEGRWKHKVNREERVGVIILYDFIVHYWS